MAPPPVEFPYAPASTPCQYESENRRMKQPREAEFRFQSSQGSSTKTNKPKGQTERKKAVDFGAPLHRRTDNRHSVNFHEEAARCQKWHCNWLATLRDSAPPRFHPHSDWAAFAARCTLGSEPSRVLSSRGRALWAQVSDRSHPDGAVRGFSF